MPETDITDTAQMRPGVNQAPAVTVLMSVYNGERFLADAISSVLQQDFTNFEFLIIDDASTDESKRIIQEHADDDDRIRLVENEENIGLTRSLNKGIDLARGEYIARIDADDLALPERVSQQRQYLNDHPDCSVIGSVAKLIDGDGSSRGQSEWFSRGALTAQLFFFNSLTHSSVMFRRNTIVALGRYDEQFTRAQDYDLWLRCVAAGHAIDILPSVLASHRVHDDRVTSTQSEKMEHFRKLALKNGWKNVLGIEVSEADLDLQHRLLRKLPIPNPPTASIACEEFRRWRQSFAKRFSREGDAINHFDHLIKRLARRLCALTGEDAALHQKYVVGQSRITYAVHKAVGSLMHRLGRARVHLGKWRRKLV